MTEDLYQVLDDKLGEALANLHTATVAKVTAVHETTIDCRPVINRVVRGESVQLPDFVEVPPISLQGGGSYTAYPIAVGDYCLLLFTERCFDRWYAGSDFQAPLEARMHDYSDGFAIVGINPQAAAIPIPEVVTTIGDAYQQGDYVHEGNREHTGDYVHTGSTVHEGDREHTGAVTQTGDTTQTGNYQLIGNLAISGNHTITGTYTATGDMVHEGSTEQTGDYVLHGDQTIDGNLTITGNLTVSGDITCGGTLTVPAAVIGGIDFGTHVHPGGQSGNPTGLPQ